MDGLPEAIASELARLDKHREEAMSLVPVAEVAHAIAAVFPDLQITVSVVRWIATPPFVCLTLDVAAFDELLPLFRDLASRGWHTDKTEPFEDYHELDRRTYSLLQPGEEMLVDPVTGKSDRCWSFKPRLRLMVFVRKENAKCRKVQTGTKTEPVYEWVCEEAGAT